MSFRLMAVRLVLLCATLSACPAALATTYHVEQRASNADDRNDGSENHPWKTISHAASEALAGDTIFIGAGVYRETVTILRSGNADRPIRFEAAPAATVIISGADRIMQWAKATGDSNIFSTPWHRIFLPDNPTQSHPSDNFHLLIGRCEQVIIMGQLLRQVLSREQLARGNFFVDFTNRRLFAWSVDDRNLADEDLICEAATRSILWDCRGDHVETVGLHFRYAANPAQRGAAVFAGAHDVIEDCIFERTNSVGAMFIGQDIDVRHCTFKDNGQLGFSATRAHGLHMTDCIVTGNNVKGFNREWEAGGDKLVLSRGVTFEHCIFRANHGTGIWFDIGCENCDVHNCLIEDNEDAGLFYEISFGLHAHDNVIFANGLADTPGSWGVGAGISLSSSSNCTIERNLLIGNKEGFSFREAERVTPRIDAASGLKPQAIWNHDEIVTHNVLAYNRDAQVYGWFDVEDERHWPATHSSLGIGHASLELLKIQFSENFYAIAPTQELLHWGVPWKKNLAYASIDEIDRALDLSRGSAQGALNFKNYAQRDFRLLSNIPPVVRACYPRGEIPDTKLEISSH